MWKQKIIEFENWRNISFSWTWLRSRGGQYQTAHVAISLSQERYCFLFSLQIFAIVWKERYCFLFSPHIIAVVSYLLYRYCFLFALQMIVMVSITALHNSSLNFLGAQELSCNISQMFSTLVDCSQTQRETISIWTVFVHCVRVFVHWVQSKKAGIVYQPMQPFWQPWVFRDEHRGRCHQTKKLYGKFSGRISQKVSTTDDTPKRWTSFKIN